MLPPSEYNYTNDELVDLPQRFRFLPDYFGPYFNYYSSNISIFQRFNPLGWARENIYEFMF